MKKNKHIYKLFYMNSYIVLVDFQISSVSWYCGIPRLHLLRVVRPPSSLSALYTTHKLSDG